MMNLNKVFLIYTIKAVPGLIYPIRFNEVAVS